MPEEIKQEVVQKTQKYLGKYVKKPQLSDKLLKKPPFRFLHDIINAVITETGFLKGLYTDAELNSDNVKERDSKVVFLNKLIEAIKVITNTELAARPSKIVAGLEPTETNLLLQAIAKALDRKLDSSAYVKQLHSGEIINNDKNRKVKKTSDKNDKIKKSLKTTNSDVKNNIVPKASEKQKSNETPKSTDRDKTKTKKTSKDLASKKSEPDTKLKTKEKSKKEKLKQNPSIDSIPPKENGTPKTADKISELNELNKINESTAANSKPVIIEEEAIKQAINEPYNVNLVSEESQIAVEGDVRSKRSTSASRPKSARPKSGDLKNKITRDENSENAEPVQIQSRPKTSLRPPSVRPSSARPGAPRLRPESGFPLKEVIPLGKINVIVENYDKDDEEETVVIHNSGSEVVEDEPSSAVPVPAENKGHLVEQILEQINESEATKSLSSTDPEWQKEVFYGKDTTTKETTNLRSLIQSLTKTANPLGKLLNYLHEDIDAMHAELESWTHTKRQLFEEINKQKKISSEMNKPLITQLEHLNINIKRVEEEVANIRSNILRNDMKIKDLLSK